ncbi:hypothetical protein GCM10010527_19660 [Streptomyces drozdowiczii]
MTTTYEPKAPSITPSRAGSCLMKSDTGAWEYRADPVAEARPGRGVLVTALTGPEERMLEWQ